MKEGDVYSPKGLRDDAKAIADATGLADTSTSWSCRKAHPQPVQDRRPL